LPVISAVCCSCHKFLDGISLALITQLKKVMGIFNGRAHHDVLEVQRPDGNGTKLGFLPALL
jgi:hypothetical protein